MRRIRIAIFILLLAAALSASSHFAVFRVTQSVQAQLSGIREAADAQNYENAAHQIDALLEYYETRQHLLEFFIRRETVTSASVSLHGLSAYANGETIQDLFSEIDKASEQIHAMEHLCHVPVWHAYSAGPSIRP